MGVDAGDELMCIVFTDLVGWTALGDRIGDDAADLIRREHFTAVRAALSAHRGSEIKTAGDSVMATFRSALDALRCALAIQEHASSGDVEVRIGVHAGELIAEDGDVFGTPVNIASRLCGAAGPGEVLLSDLIRSLLGNRGDFAFQDAGPLALKGLRDPVHAHRLKVGKKQEASARLAPRRVAPQRLSQLRPIPAMLCPVIVGRGDELAALTDQLNAAAGGNGSVVGLVGDAGVGKSRMSREIVEQARARGFATLLGRSVPGESPVPYRPLTEALVAAFRSSGPPNAPELAGFGGHLGRLVPEWRADTEGRTPSQGGADESPVLLAEAVVRLLRIVGRERGCVLLLEDVHWADVETLAVVEYLADALREEPVLCVCTTRPAGAATELLARLRRHDGAVIIGVSPLGDADIDRVVSACLDTDGAPGDVLSFVTAKSEGNPFLIEELLAGLVASGRLVLDDHRWRTDGVLSATVPFDFAESIQQRLAPLDATTRRVIAAAAVLGRRFDWELLPGVAEVDGQKVIEALRLAVDEQLIEVEGNDFKFRHALTREAVLADLLPPERQVLSRRAWPAIERAHPGLPGPWCEMAAELAEASGDRVAAAERLVESASRAMANGALATAELTAARAQQLAASDVDVCIAADEVLVQILALAGKPHDAAAIGVPLVDLLTKTSAPADRRANLLTVLARAALTAGDAADAAAYADRARGLISEGSVGDAVAARVEAVAAHVALEQVRLEEAETLARSAAELAAATNQPAVECEALEALGRVARPRDAHEGTALLQRAAALAEQHGLASWNLRARHELAIHAVMQGLLQPMHQTRALAVQQGALVTVAVMDLAIADMALAAFDRIGCLAASQSCVDASRRYGLATLPVAYLWLAGAHALAGQEPEMEAAATQAMERDPHDPRILGDLWGRVRATHAVVRDDRAELRRDLDTMMEYVRIAPITTSIFPNRMLWAMVHTVEDDDHGAAARAELATATNLSWWPQFSSFQGMLEAIALGRDGARDAASARFTPAADRLSSFTLVMGSTQYLHVLAAEAAIRDGWGEPAKRLREAEAFFTAGGYDLVARRCRSLLAEAGAPVPRRGRGGSVVPPSLRALGITSRELDVLNLVAEGLSNREIAERLVLSPKTVERHMASLFNRTGIRNRGALGDFARSQTE